MDAQQEATQTAIISMIGRAYRHKKAREEALRSVQMFNRSQPELDQLLGIWTKLAADSRAELDRIILAKLSYDSLDDLGATLPEQERRAMVAKTLQPFVRVAAIGSGIKISADECRVFIESFLRRSEVESCTTHPDQP